MQRPTTGSTYEPPSAETDHQVAESHQRPSVPSPAHQLQQAWALVLEKLGEPTGRYLLRLFLELLFEDADAVSQALDDVDLDVNNIGRHRLDVPDHRARDVIGRTAHNRGTDGLALALDLHKYLDVRLVAFIEIGAAMGNRRVHEGSPLAGTTARQAARALANLGVPVYAVDQPREFTVVREEIRHGRIRAHDLWETNVFYVSGDGLEMLRPQIDGRNCAVFGRPIPAIDRNGAICIRSQNSTGLYCGKAEIKAWLPRLAVEFRDQVVIVLLQRSIRIKPAGDLRFLTRLGLLHRRGFLPYGELLHLDGQPPYVIYEEALELVRARQARWQYTV